MLLWVGARPLEETVSDHSRSSLAAIKSLRKAGLEVKFLAADFQRNEPHASVLNKLGIETLDGDWYRHNWHSWLEDNERLIDFVCFDDDESCTVFLPVIQRLAKAAVFYWCNQLSTNEKLSSSESYALANSDVVLISGETDEAKITASFPEKLIVPADFNNIAEILPAARDAALFRIARSRINADTPKPARLIAFYLPQYHPIPENNEWWGDGFTEWHNVKKTTPLFSGHYQPHVPADLGYYDLREQETRIAQATLASQYGIEGFCYYHYWFEGKRLLERPLQELIDSGKPDFPFCLCWANESWSRRWDGKDQEILMRQSYSEEDDLEHIRALIPLFEDHRYIRINGKPLFLVYRAENIPDPIATTGIWRQEARKLGLGELYLCRVESFVKGDPVELGFDASIEFAPDWWNKGAQLDAESELFRQSDPKIKQVCESNYIHSYQGLTEAMMSKEIPDYKWMRCVTPSWDNWARRNEGASVFLGSTPDIYQDWLTSSVDNTNMRLHGEERIVFINAWNEWAEGNHLEPDQKFGHGYLEATRQALSDGQLATEVRRLGAADEMHVNRLATSLANSECKLNELESEMDDVLLSTSWRVTVPLRWVKQLMLDLKSKVSGSN